MNDLSAFKIQQQETKLVIEWDNREVPKSIALTLFTAVFWLFWTPATIFMTCVLAGGGSPEWFIIPWLILAYLGVFGIPVIWLLRRSVERIEIDKERYRHQFVGFPRWFQREWDVSDITKVHFGLFDEEETIETLSVSRGRSRDIIAYWAKSHISRQLFDVIKSHLQSINSPIPVVSC